MSMDFRKEDLIIKISVIFAFLSLSLGGLFGLLQIFTRTPGSPISLSANLYYLALTAHGVLMAIVWTAFFIIAIAIFVTTRMLNIHLNSKLLYSGAIISLFGTLMAFIAIVSGQANVLYTFYPPLKASPLFYIGVTVLVIGTWIIGACIFLAVLAWRKLNRKVGLPIAVYGVIATLIVWLEATPGLFIELVKNLIPMSLFGVSIDVLESRALFWYFGHALVYFWLIPAVTLWYYLVPTLLKTELYDETMAKVAFIIFIITSTPVGLHHQLVDPAIDPSYKFLQTILTYTVAIASFLTAFNIIATMEKSNASKGLFSWIKGLPWKNPVFSGITLSFILFGFGGISGLINTSYTLNYVVHNTTWIVGHFHLMVGTAVTLTFMSASYLLVPIFFGRSLIMQKLANLQPYLWFLGMAIFSAALHIAGLEGMPRRTNDIGYGGLAPFIWTTLSQVAMVGGIIVFTAGVIFILVISMSILKGPKLSGASIEMKSKSNYTVFDRLSIWISLAIVIIVIAYMLPFLEIYLRGLSTAPPQSPF